MAVGPDVEGFPVGDRVLVHEAPLPGGSGFWAERVLITAASAGISRRGWIRCRRGRCLLPGSRRTSRWRRWGSAGVAASDHQWWWGDRCAGVADCCCSGDRGDGDGVRFGC
ncbi:hypothetical protein ABZX69_41630 [Streptomyces sp. NPDC004074]|uniref:hypothetical protein n=1 Tax=Streptomyces sp. NPDC004074 TaxID=3154277 RepID=UPI0033AF20A2